MWETPNLVSCMNHVCIRGSKVTLTWIEIIQAYIGQFVLNEIIMLATHIAIVETLPTTLETKSATIMLVARITMETPNKLTTLLALKLQ
jgi:hypothetical protein